jgi:hypothetical protein
MRGGRLMLAGAVALALGSGPTWAEAPETILRPQARPAPEAPMRPRARPDEGTADVVVEAGATVDEVTPESPLDRVAGEPAPEEPEDSPAALSEVTGPTGVPSPPADETTLPGQQPPPAVARQAPTLALIVDRPVYTGPAQMVRAERAMSDPPAPPVFQDAWDGATPPLRPATVAERPQATGTQSPVLRPEARPDALPAVQPGPVAQLRPRARPAAPQDPAPLVPTEPDAPPIYAPGAQPGVLPDGPGYSTLAVARALRPEERPRNITARVEQQRAEQARGSVCGSPSIQGEVVAAVQGSGGCGISEPVRIRSVSGINLSTPALMDCQTAQALDRWVANGAIPAVGDTGGGLRTLQVMGHYTCRPINNQSGQRLSEHGKGRAIDIGGFGLRNGTQITVLRGWNRQGESQILRAMHRAACGPFGTVLGPEANRFHADHFHFDTAQHRNGSYCR